MDIRRIAIAATLAVVALLPNLGHAVGDKNHQVPGTACTVGDETLTYDTALTGWVVQGSANCGTTNYSNINMNLVLMQIQGVSTTQPGILTGGSVLSVSSSCSAAAGYTGTCAALTIGNGAAPRPTLAMGLYMLKSQAVVFTTNQQLSGMHGTCFLVNNYQATVLLDGCFIG